jgi:predicted amino acid racemase
MSRARSDRTEGFSAPNGAVVWGFVALALGLCSCRFFSGPQAIQSSAESQTSDAVQIENRISSSPRLVIYQKRITSNARAILAQAKEQSVHLAAVVKGASAHPAVVHALMEAGIDMLADSRLINIQRIRNAGFKGDVLLMRPASLTESPQVVLNADFSLVSNLKTAQSLSEAAANARLTHNIIVMVEAGDLREGIYPPADALTLARQIHDLPNLRLAGLGANFACNAGVLPDTKNTASLVDLSQSIEKALKIRLAYVSTGNSSGLPLLRSCALPKGVNHYRVGESILLGSNAVDGTPWPGTRQDAFIFVAEVIEAYKKPSLPWGETAGNAFGERTEYIDRGHRTRAIVNAGRQDIEHTSLTPENPCMQIINSSSDHMILDVEDCASKPKVGDEISFRLGYPALLRATTSDYVAKTVIFDDSSWMPQVTPP